MEEEYTPEEAAAELEKWCKDYGITFKMTPIAQSTLEALNKTAEGKQKHLQVCWVVDMYYKDKVILSTPYTAGVAHIEGHQYNPGPAKWDLEQAYKEICENKTTVVTLRLLLKGAYGRFKLRRKDPSAATIMSCLLMDAFSYYDNPKLNDFFKEFGYEDVEAGIRAYEACQNTWIVLNKYIGQAVLDKLTTIAYQM